MTRLTLLLGAALCLALAGCASTPAKDSTDPDEYSQLPWNRPQKWEGTGQLGALAQ